jgi:predicted metalloprotease with PDZ domain
MLCLHFKFYMKKLFLIYLNTCIAFAVNAQQYIYQLDIANIINDQILVTATVPKVSSNAVVYHFPKTVPGTYAVEDYGNYIQDFKAYDKNDKLLAATKQGNNDYLINQANELHSISYLVNDAMDMKVKENKIFEPASTNIEAGKNVLMNNGGFFGYLDNTELLPISILIKKPSNYFGATSLTTTRFNNTEQEFKAKDYHQLVDCPILFAAPDTATFKVNNATVTIACYDVTGQKRAKYFYNELKRDMEGVAKFLPQLPVDRYTFLLYVDDLTKFNGIFSGTDKIGFSKAIQLYKTFKSLGIGALEHGNSSTYYLANLGENLKMKDLKLENQLTAAAIHEFMHIVTPLGLHSQHIGNFNYANPVMSKHLWLYEGVTEYNAHLIKLQSGIYTKEEFLDEMNNKIRSGNSFPITKMSFTQMSENVLKKPFKKEYIHVYDRGAALAWLLDMRIIKLTNGAKTLKDVVLQLSNKYGKDKSFDESTFITEFVEMVDPKLQQFFDDYITGNIDWKLNEDLNNFGVSYIKKKTIKVPANPFSNDDNEIKLKKQVLNLFGKTVKKVYQGEFAGLQKGDMVENDTYKKIMQPKGKFVAENTLVNYPIRRNGSNITIPFKVVYVEDVVHNYLEFDAQPTVAQQKLWTTFIGN